MFLDAQAVQKITQVINLDHTAIIRQGEGRKGTLAKK